MSDPSDIPAAPFPPPDQASVPPPKPRRGGWLTAFLVLMFLTNALAAATYFGKADTVLRQGLRLTPGLVSFLGLMSVLNLVLTALVWRWRKIGVYGFVAVSAVVLFVNLSIGVSPLKALLGPLGALFLWLLTRPKWASFR